MSLLLEPNIDTCREVPVCSWTGYSHVVEADRSKLNNVGILKLLGKEFSVKLGLGSRFRRVAFATASNIVSDRRDRALVFFGGFRGL